MPTLGRSRRFFSAQVDAILLGRSRRFSPAKKKEREERKRTRARERTAEAATKRPRRPINAQVAARPTDRPTEHRRRKRQKPNKISDALPSIRAEDAYAGKSGSKRGPQEPILNSCAKLASFKMALVHRAKVTHYFSPSRKHLAAFFNSVTELFAQQCHTDLVVVAKDNVQFAAHQVRDKHAFN